MAVEKHLAPPHIRGSVRRVLGEIVSQERHEEKKRRSCGRVKKEKT
ncbi:MAG: hypothetical protein ABDH61_00625 [Acidilobaceae archaeon]